MKIKDIISTIFITTIVSGFLLFTGFSKTKADTPNELYQVYLNDEKIALIYDEEELYDLINEEQKDLKEEYGVDNVYPPEGLKISKCVTYDDNISSAEDVYEIIKEKEPFTIQGYILTVNDKFIDENEVEQTKTTYVNVMSEEILTNSLEEIVKTFIGDDEYEKFIENTQDEIVDVGTIIEAVFFNESLTIKQAFLDTSETIFRDEATLTHYLLFQTTEPQASYTIKSGDDIDTVAFNNKLNVKEFLIINPEIKNENQLLAVGEKVNIGLINPVVNVVCEMNVVEDISIDYETIIKEDDTKSTSYREVEQQGETGISRATEKVKTINGEKEPVIILSSQEIKPAVDEIIIKGTKRTGSVSYGDTINWKWPTNKPYVITSGYGYREGEFHPAIDISGTGHGSPIYAAAAGVVIYAGWTNLGGGNRVMIDHNNGYYTMYSHLDSIVVNVGDIVSASQVVGTMGKTGRATGTHLHFAVYTGSNPLFSNASTINPLKLYRR